MNETAGQLDIGGVISATTDIWKETLGTVWVIAVILMVPAGIISALLSDQGVLLSMIGSLVTLVATLVFAITFVVGLIVTALTGASTVLGVIGGIVLMVLFYPWLAIVYSVLYFRLRDLRGEGLAAAAPAGGDELAG